MQANTRIVTFLAAVVLTAGSAFAQNAGTSPVYKLRMGENKVTIFEKFTTILQHTARIKSVLDFDAEVIKIDPVQGHPDQVTVYALATGVTTVTLIDEFDQFNKIEVLVQGDVRHLESYLKRLYPNDAIRAEEIKGSVLLTGWVTRPEHINEMVGIAEQFYPNVLNHMRIGGVQQVMLKATIMEVNRTKLRQMGMNFGLIKNDSYLLSTPGPITPIGNIAATGTGAQVTWTGFSNSTISFGFMDPSKIFQGYVDALLTEGLLKIHATPMVVTHNGTPAALLNGGEAPVLVPAGLGTTAIEFKPFGVILNAVPHILGNGRLKLQVEPSVVERDFANSVTVGGVTVPSFTVRKVSTQVEMNFGETLVIGGLISRREDASTQKVPFFGELPWIGAAFSRKQYNEVETELIILVTPEFVAPMSPEQVPAGGPGKFTDAPTDHELFWHGLLEIPKTGPECDAVFNCTQCSQNGYCSQHPNGKWGFGNGAACKGCGKEGCADCGPATITPMMISPAPPQSAGLITPSANSEQLPEPTINTTTPVSAARIDGASEAGRATTAYPTGKASSTSQQRPGLISPLMR
ncbi:MAG: hypothetical protein WAO83_19105 [Fuerstiella sp.]